MAQASIHDPGYARVMEETGIFMAQAIAGLYAVPQVLKWSEKFVSVFVLSDRFKTRMALFAMRQSKLYTETIHLGQTR